MKYKRTKERTNDKNERNKYIKKYRKNEITK